MLITLASYSAVYGGCFLFLYVLTYFKFIYGFVSSTLLLGFIAYLSHSIANLIWERYIRKSNLLPIEKVNPKNRSVLITGCDTGFGNKLACRLVDYGFTVFAACLNENSPGAKQLKNYGKSNKVFIIKMDVTKQDEVDQAVEIVSTKIQQNNSQLFALVNNAGIMVSTEIEFGPVSLFENQLNVNCIGSIRVTKAFLPLLRKASLINQKIVKKSNQKYSDLNENGVRIVNVCSLAGRFAIPGIVSYCVSKASLVSFSDGLRREVSKWGINVVTIEPHLFRTNLVNSENQHSALDNAWKNSLKEVQESYGESYFEGYKRYLDKMIDSARGSVEDVVDTMVVAVTDKFVARSYRVVKNDLENLRLGIYRFIPERALDLIGYLLYDIGKPAALIIQSTQPDSTSSE